MRRSILLIPVIVLLALPAWAEGGTISGTVEARRARSIPNTVVYLEQVPGEFPPAAEPVEMDQINQVFTPFVLPVVQGTTVRFLNNDATGHNVFSPDGEEYDLGTWGQGEARDYTFSSTGVYTQLCSLHPSMIAYILVLQNSHFAIVGEDGTFSLENIPAGTYSLRVWNERKEADPQEVTVTDGATATIAISLR